MNMYDISNIAGFETFLKIELVDKGWSKDKKYYIETVDNRRLLLRISDISEYERKKIEFGMMQQLMELAIPMSQPIEFGICDRGNSVYVLLTWCDGEDAETRLPALTEIEQYNLGIKAGEILKKLHSIPASKAQEDWAIRFNKKINTKIKKYHDCGISFEGDSNIMAYIEQNREFLENRPQCYQHGDYLMVCCQLLILIALILATRGRNLIVLCGVLQSVHIFPRVSLLVTLAENLR